MLNFHVAFYFDVGIPNLSITSIVTIILFSDTSHFTQVAL